MGEKASGPPPFLSPMCSAQKAFPLLLPFDLFCPPTPFAIASSAEVSRKSRAKRRQGERIESIRPPCRTLLPSPSMAPRTDEVGGMEREILETQLPTLERRLIPCCCLPSPFTLPLPERAAAADGPWVGGEINRLKIGLPAQKTIRGL